MSLAKKPISLVFRFRYGLCLHNNFARPMTRILIDVSTSLQYRRYCIITLFWCNFPNNRAFELLDRQVSSDEALCRLARFAHNVRDNITEQHYYVVSSSGNRGNNPLPGNKKAHST